MPHEDFSPYGHFQKALRFVDVFRKSTKQKLYKFELWESYRTDEHAISEIAAKKHPDFDFIPNPIRQKESEDFWKIMRGLKVN